MTHKERSPFLERALEDRAPAPGQVRKGFHRRTIGVARLAAWSDARSRLRAKVCSDPGEDHSRRRRLRRKRQLEGYERVLLTGAGRCRRPTHYFMPRCEQRPFPVGSCGRPSLRMSGRSWAFPPSTFPKHPTPPNSQRHRPHPHTTTRTSTDTRACETCWSYAFAAPSGVGSSATAVRSHAKRMVMMVTPRPECCDPTTGARTHKCAPPLCINACLRL